LNFEENFRKELYEIINEFDEHHEMYNDMEILDILIQITNIIKKGKNKKQNLLFLLNELRRFKYQKKNHEFDLEDGVDDFEDFNSDLSKMKKKKKKNHEFDLEDGVDDFEDFNSDSLNLLKRKKKCLKKDKDFFYY
jgi:hypothetical protein